MVNYLSSSAALKVVGSALASGVALLAVVAGVTSESLDLLLAVLLASLACVWGFLLDDDRYNLG